MNTVFFNAINKRIHVKLNGNAFGAYVDAASIAQRLKRKGVRLHNTTFLHSSDVDFASEEGFATDSAAHDIIDEALAKLA